MRVLHVSEVAGGGVLRLLEDYTHDQRRRGMEVHTAWPARRLELEGVTHHRWAANRRRPWAAPRYARQLRAIVDEVRPDVVHLHSFFAGVFGRLPGAIPAGVPVIYQPHSWAFDAVPAVLTPAVAGFERWAAGHTDLVLTNCEDEIAEAGRYRVHPDRAMALGVSVDLTRFTPVDEREKLRLREVHGVPTDTSIYLCLGRITRQKGQQILVPAWDQAPDPDGRLYLVGPGDPGTLAGLAPRTWNRSLFAVGETDHPEDWYRLADVLVVPSLYEGQSVTISEALACGLPVVCCVVNGARLAIGDDAMAAGALVEQGDTYGLLSEARRRVRDPGLRAAEGQHGRTRMESQADPEQILGRLAKIYAEFQDADGIGARRKR